MVLPLQMSFAILIFPSAHSIVSLFLWYTLTLLVFSSHLFAILFFISLCYSFLNIFLLFFSSYLFTGLFFISLCYSFLHISLQVFSSYLFAILFFFSSYLFAILFFISLYRSFLRTFLILSSLCLFSQKDLFLHTLHLVIELAPAARLISIGLFDTAAYFYSLNVVGLTVSFLPHQPTRDKQAAATDWMNVQLCRRYYNKVMQRIMTLISKV